MRLDTSASLSGVNYLTSLNTTQIAVVGVLGVTTIVALKIIWNCCQSSAKTLPPGKVTHTANRPTVSNAEYSKYLWSFEPTHLSVEGLVGEEQHVAAVTKYISEKSYSHLLINPDDHPAQNSIETYLGNRAAFDKAVLEFAKFYFQELQDRNVMTKVPLLNEQKIGNYSQYPLSLKDGEGIIGIGALARNLSFKKEVVQTTTKKMHPYLILRTDYDGSTAQQIEPVIYMFPHHTDLIIQFFRTKGFPFEESEIRILHQIRDKQIPLIEGFRTSH